MGTDNLTHLPAELRDAAKKLPVDKRHTVLQLKDEGEGHNASLITVAAICYKMGVSADDTLTHLLELYSEDRIDYHKAPLRAVQRIWEGDGEIIFDDEHGSFDPSEQEEMLLRFRRTSFADIKAESPHKTNIKPVRIIKDIFRPDDIINIQQSAFEVGTLVYAKDIKTVDDIDSYKFLNPSTFKKLEGIANPLDNDKIATRCNANVALRTFMLLEMDSKDESRVERFNTLMMVMAKFFPLVLMVDTGGKSGHAWFDTSKATKAIVSAVFALACIHGADKRMGVRSQIARMPNVNAEKDGRGFQRVIYYDPAGENAPDKWDLEGFEKYLQTAQQLEYYYWPDKQRYYMQDNTASWVALNRQSMMLHLADAGFRITKVEGEAISPAEKILVAIERDRSVDTVLKGASGKHAGFYEENGNRILVAKSPILIKPRKGRWDTIEMLLRAIFDQSPDQYEVLMGWLSSGVRDFRNGGKRQARMSQAQFLICAGPANSGKTFFGTVILPYLFGCRWSKADSMFKQTVSQFNSGQFMAELQVLDDTSVLGTSHQARTIFGERIKGVTVAGGGEYEQKHSDSVQLAPWWRLVRFMNEEPQTIATLPPLVEGIEDKLIILQCASMMDCADLDTDGVGWQDRLVKQLTEELPAFIHYLLNEHHIPAEILDPSRRFAVRSFKNADILGELWENSPESYIIHKIDHDARRLLFYRGDAFNDEADVIAPWRGSANELYDLLSESGSNQAQSRFRKICPSPKVLLAQLRCLEKDFPTRLGYSKHNENMQPRKHKGNHYWGINPPDMPIIDIEPNIDDLI